MQFLSDVYLRCPDCNGQRYRPEVLEVTLERDGRHLNVAHVLELTVSEAAQPVLPTMPTVSRALQPIVEVGLEYVRLGQPVPTLSGGEAQRLKLAGFWPKRRQRASRTSKTKAKTPGPTAGQQGHAVPVRRAHHRPALRRHRQTACARCASCSRPGHSLVVIEHNLDVIRASDWLIDLGPEGGEGGGLVVAEGTPEEVQQHPHQPHRPRLARLRRRHGSAPWRVYKRLPPTLRHRVGTGHCVRQCGPQRHPHCQRQRAQLART